MPITPPTIAHHLSRWGILAAAALMTAACALSPHAVSIKPTPQIQDRDLGRGRTIALEVVDLRPRPAFGARGGVYAETSLITPAGDIAAPIRSTLLSALQRYRFVVVAPGDQPPLRLRVEVEDIRYQASGAARVSQVRTEAAVRVVLQSGAREYRARYAANQTRDVLNAPSPQENERIINEILSKALERMLNDGEFLKFLAD